MGGRDRCEFSGKTKRMLAERVNYLCSNPSCKAPTLAGDCFGKKSISVGEAAHITAASPGGPRYAAELSDDMRADISNGIWLCRNCAALIDRDVDRYTAEELCRWKAEAEAYAKKVIGKPNQANVVSGGMKASIAIERIDVPTFAFAFEGKIVPAAFFGISHHDIPFTWDLAWIDKAAIVVVVQNPADNHPLIIDNLEVEVEELVTEYGSGVQFIKQGVSKALEFLISVSDDGATTDRIERDCDGIHVVEKDFFANGNYIEIPTGQTEVLLLKFALVGGNVHVIPTLSILENGQRHRVGIPNERGFKLVGSDTIPIEGRAWTVHLDGRASGAGFPQDNLEEWRGLLAQSR